jgi:hypothetical protein
MIAALDGELARLNARYMAFAFGPEARARARIDALRDKDRRFRNGTGPRLGRCERAELRGLATLYPREIPEIDEEFLVRESVFSERPLDFEEPSDFQEGSPSISVAHAGSFSLSQRLGSFCRATTFTRTQARSPT